MSLRWCMGFNGNWQHVSCREFIHADHGATDDAAEQFGLFLCPAGAITVAYGT